MAVLVSACLLGDNCKYNGKNNLNEKVIRHLQGKETVKICPEILADLGAPREPMELAQGKPVNKGGKDMSIPVEAGIKKALAQISDMDIEYAVLQSRSPTCGVKQIYDGSFSGQLIDGQGLFAKALKDAGYRVIDAEDI